MEGARRKDGPIGLQRGSKRNQENGGERETKRIVQGTSRKEGPGGWRGQKERGTKRMAKGTNKGPKDGGTRRKEGTGGLPRDQEKRGTKRIAKGTTEGPGGWWGLEGK